MGRLGQRLIGAWVVVAAPISANAQAPVPSTAPAVTVVATPKQELGGIPTLDVISLRADGPGAPLRFGNVIPGSERIQLNGRLLIPTDDYAMDYSTGVVYLKVAQRRGDSLTVSYRYDSKATSTASNNMAGIAGFQYSLLPGAFNFLTGLGVAERAADGSVLTSNVVGWNNAFKFGESSNLKGLYIYADRKKSENKAGLQMDRDAKYGDALTDTGTSQFLVQNFQSAIAGGSLQLDYQDVSKNFSNFGAVRQAGYAEGDVTRLTAERGLTRKALGLKDLKFGGMSFSNGYKTVGDNTGGVTWRTLAMQSGGLKLSSSSQKVDNNFQRFKDLSEADREQLARERGMSRENFAGEFAQKTSKLTFSTNEVSDDVAHTKIERREIGLDAGLFKFATGTQEISNNFGRISSLTGAEQANWGREVGVKRKWLSFDSKFLGKTTDFSFKSSELNALTGKFSSQNIGYVGKTWSLQHVEVGSTSNFGSMRAMQDAEADAHVKDIAAMYGPNVAIKPEERNAFLSNAGLRRDFTGLTLNPFKDFEARFSTLKLQGVSGSGQVDTLDIKNKKYELSIRRQDLSKQFTDASRLMEFERNRVGTLAGLSRSDFSLTADLGKSQKLVASQMSANTAEGMATRTNLGINTKNLQLEVNSRKVGSNFANVGQMTDSESQLLNNMIGFSEKDVKADWAVSSNLRVKLFSQDAMSKALGQARRDQHTEIDWSPDKKTQFSFYKSDTKNTDPLGTLFANATERMSLTRDFGKFGKMQYIDEVVSFDGRTVTDPDHHKRYLAFETKLTDKTSLKTEQTRTDFGNGQKEEINSNTVSTEISKRAGVSLTDTKIDRTGNTSDEAHRNVGFWVDLGNGLKLSYGYARQLVGETNGTMTSTLALGQNAQSLSAADKINTAQAGNLGGFMVGGGYGVNRWDQQSGSDMRTQSFSNVSVTTAKPFKLGLLTDIKVNFGLDTAADYSKWLRENRAMGISGKLGVNTFAFAYKSQIAPNGDRGIDRAFNLQTDASEQKTLRAAIAYKVRTLPSDQQVMIRDFNITAKPVKNVEVTNLLQTNPEAVKGDAFLGSIYQASRSNEWKIDFKNNPDMTFGGSWKELINEQANSKSTTGGVNLKLFQKSGSPLTLFYGIEQSEGNVKRRLVHRYHLQFDQKPGPNQMFTLFVGNVSYEHSIADNQLRNNLTVRFDYQLRF